MGGDQRYLIALGSNRRHHGHGTPADTLRAAIARLGEEGADVEAVSPILANPAIGPSRRQFANAAAVIRTGDAPVVLLARLKRIERDFGRRRGGRRWGERVLDLDIVLWSGGVWRSPGLAIPHPAFRERDFVLRPAAAIAPTWRDPESGLSINQLLSRLTKPRPIPR